MVWKRSKSKDMNWGDRQNLQAALCLLIAKYFLQRKSQRQLAQTAFDLNFPQTD